MREESLRRFCGQAVVVAVTTRLPPTTICGKHFPAINVHDEQFGYLAHVGNGIACFDYIQFPAQTYRGFNVLARTIDSIHAVAP